MFEPGGQARENGKQIVFIINAIDRWPALGTMYIMKFILDFYCFGIRHIIVVHLILLIVERLSV